MSITFAPPSNRDARPDGALLLTLLRRLAYNAPEAVITLTHLEAQWSAEKFDPDWLAKIGVEALPTTAPSAETPPLTLDVEDFKRLCQSVHQFEILGLRLSVGGKTDLDLRIVGAEQWRLDVPGKDTELAALLKELGADIL